HFPLRLCAAAGHARPLPSQPDDWRMLAHLSDVLTAALMSRLPAAAWQEAGMETTERRLLPAHLLVYLIPQAFVVTGCEHVLPAHEALGGIWVKAGHSREVIKLRHAAARRSEITARNAGAL